MNILDKLLSKRTTDAHKRKLENAISTEAQNITSKVMRGKCTTKDIDLLQQKYDDYFGAYPNAIREESARVRIAKLRSFIK